VTIAVALSFDSGILLCADAQRPVPARLPRECTNVFSRCYGSRPADARSIFATSDASEPAIAVLHACERALDVLAPADFVLDRMRAAIESALHDSQGRLAAAFEEPLFAALYSPHDRQCSLFRTRGAGLQEVVGYECHGSASHVAHCLIRERYKAAQSMDSLDLTTAFAIATEAVEAVRDGLGGCGESTEVMVLYANGRASDVQRIRRDTTKQRTLALLGHLPT
jgi:hypothetical protein